MLLFHCHADENLCQLGWSQDYSLPCLTSGGWSQCTLLGTIWVSLSECLSFHYQDPKYFEGFRCIFLFYFVELWIPFFTYNSSSLEQIPVPSLTWVSIAIMHVPEQCRKTPMSLPRWVNPNGLSLSSRSSHYTHTTSGKLYRALFNLPTYPGFP